jgi:hypothetical protein
LPLDVWKRVKVACIERNTNFTAFLRAAIEHELECAREPERRPPAPPQALPRRPLPVEEATITHAPIADVPVPKGPTRQSTRPQRRRT